jgi:hypothetical protein
MTAVNGSCHHRTVPATLLLVVYDRMEVPDVDCSLTVVIGFAVMKENESCHTSNVSNPYVCDNPLPPLAALSAVSASPQSNLPYPPQSVAPCLDPFPLETLPANEESCRHGRRRFALEPQPLSLSLPLILCDYCD